MRLNIERLPVLNLAEVNLLKMRSAEVSLGMRSFVTMDFAAMNKLAKYRKKEVRKRRR